MMVQRSGSARSFAPNPTKRWHEWVRRGQIFCNEHPWGHHIPNTFGVTEGGYIQCGRKVPDLPPHMVEMELLISKRLYREADQHAIALRSSGIDVPSKEEIAKMARSVESHPCGRNVFMMNVRGGAVFVAEVSLDEQRDMEHLSTPAEILDYLGVLNTNR
jgi:hypothetical protein